MPGPAPIPLFLLPNMLPKYPPPVPVAGPLELLRLRRQRNEHRQQRMRSARQPIRMGRVMSEGIDVKGAGVSLTDNYPCDCTSDKASACPSRPGCGIDGVDLNPGCDFGFCAGLEREQSKSEKGSLDLVHGEVEWWSVRVIR